MAMPFGVHLTSSPLAFSRRRASKRRRREKRGRRKKVKRKNKGRRRRSRIIRKRRRMKRKRRRCEKLRLSWLWRSSAARIVKRVVSVNHLVLSLNQQNLVNLLKVALLQRHLHILSHSLRHLNQQSQIRQHHNNRPPQISQMTEQPLQYQSSNHLSINNPVRTKLKMYKLPLPVTK